MKTGAEYHRVTMTAQSQYAAVARVPLIKSPSLRVPQLVSIPPTIHPLPDSVTAYFVYPFTLEPHVANIEATRQSTLDGHMATCDAYLKRREEEKEQRKKEALRKVAPGFEPSAGTLVPQRVGGNSSQPDAQAVSSSTTQSIPRDPMADLVNQLAALDAAHDRRPQLTH